MITFWRRLPPTLPQCGTEVIFDQAWRSLTVKDSYDHKPALSYQTEAVCLQNLQSPLRAVLLSCGFPESKHCTAAPVHLSCSLLLLLEVKDTYGSQI